MVRGNIRRNQIAHSASNAGLAIGACDIQETRGELSVADPPFSCQYRPSFLPVTVQVPIGIAANVCNVAANVLAADIQQTGEATCDAETTSTGLIRLVQQQM